MTEDSGRRSLDDPGFDLDVRLWQLSDRLVNQGQALHDKIVGSRDRVSRHAVCHARNVPGVDRHELGLAQAGFFKSPPGRSLASG